MRLKQKLKHWLVQTEAYRYYWDASILRNEKKRLISEAKDLIANLDVSASKQTLLAKYIIDFKKYRFSFNEWHYLYHLESATEDYKREFISRSYGQKWYRRTIDFKVREIFHNKRKFLQFLKNKDLLHREFMFIDKGDKNNEKALEDFIQRKDIVLKPSCGTCGSGIFIMKRNSEPENEVADIINKTGGSEYIAEECIGGHPDVQKIHPSSLNSIRVVTSYDGAEYKLQFAILRCGSGGNFLDNFHANGYCCIVNAETGCLEGKAIDFNGKLCERHPDTGVVFDSIKIPCWDKVKASCLNLHRSFDIPFVGWDVCVTSGEEVEFIEANHAPDVDIVQSVTGLGFAEEFKRVCKGFRHHSMLRKFKFN